MDNASYHSRRTDETRSLTSSTLKGEMQAWLTRRGIVWHQDMLKRKLYNLVKQHRPTPTFVVNKIAEEQGFLVLRLPVGHCELNPIELIWAQIKGEVATRNTTFHLKDVQWLTDEAIRHLTVENWRKACHHVWKVEEEYWKSDGILDGMVEQLLINIGDDDEDDRADGSDGSDFDALSDVEDQ